MPACRIGLVSRKLLGGASCGKAPSHSASGASASKTGSCTVTRSLVPFDRLQAATEAIRQQRFGSGSAPEVVPLPRNVAASPGALYLHSREVIEELL